jgi:hypothetical protein
LAAAFQHAADAIDASVAFNLPGVSVVVAFKGKTIFSHGAGEVKKGSGTVPDEDTVFRIGSVSKVFPVLQAYMMSSPPSVPHAGPRSLRSLDDPFDAVSPHSVKVSDSMISSSMVHHLFALT